MEKRNLFQVFFSRSIIYPYRISRCLQTDKEGQLIRELLQPLHRFLGYVSQTKIDGWLPLDILAHFFIGMILALAFLTKKVSHIKTFIIILALALIKEAFDSFSLTASLGEAIKDVLVTIAFPALTLIAANLKKS